MPQIDFFNFFRYVLGTIVTIYATVVSLQSLWTWCVFWEERTNMSASSAATSSCMAFGCDSKRSGAMC